MKLKYYLRGLGVGIVVTAVILTIANHLGNKMSDEDIIKRAAKLGMELSAIIFRQWEESNSTLSVKES